MVYNFVKIFITFVAVFFVCIVLTKFLPHRIDGDTVYSPESYINTIDSAINGRVVELNHFRVLSVKLDNGEIFNLLYSENRMPVNWQKKYPNEFIVVGDTVYKEAMTTEFFIIRDGKRWKYYLPEVKKRR